MKKNNSKKEEKEFKYIFQILLADYLIFNNKENFNKKVLEKKIEELFEIQKNKIEKTKKGKETIEKFIKIVATKIYIAELFDKKKK